MGFRNISHGWHRLSLEGRGQALRSWGDEFEHGFADAIEGGIRFAAEALVSSSKAFRVVWECGQRIFPLTPAGITLRRGLGPTMPHARHWHDDGESATEQGVWVGEASRTQSGADACWTSWTDWPSARNMEKSRCCGMIAALSFARSRCAALLRRTEQDARGLWAFSVVYP